LTKEEVQEYLKKYGPALGFFYTITETAGDGKEVVVYTRWSEELMREPD